MIVNSLRNCNCNQVLNNRQQNNNCCHVSCCDPKKLKVNLLVGNQLVPESNAFDIDLNNAWGIVVINNTLWVSVNGSSLITSYSLLGDILPTRINVIDNLDNPLSPTGIVENKQSFGFLVSKNGVTKPGFLFVATEEGTVNAYNKLVDPDNAIVVINRSAAMSVYKGLAFSPTHLYVADFRNRQIDVFDSNYTEIFNFPFIDQNDVDPIPADFAPFNIVNINNLLYVLYAKQQPPQNEDDQPGPGNGFVSIFDLQGNFIKRFISRGYLNSPWGFVLAPPSFGFPEGSFLVGNFGDSVINVYDPCGNHLGNLVDKNGDTIVLDGLWGLARNPGNCNTLYWASGPDEELNGLVGNIEAVAHHHNRF